MFLGVGVGVLLVGIVSYAYQKGYKDGHSAGYRDRLVQEIDQEHAAEDAELEKVRALVRDAAARPAASPSLAPPAPESVVDEDYPVAVSGEGAHQEILRRLVGPVTDSEKQRRIFIANLGPQPDHPDDPGAIIVRIANDPVGVLGKPLAKRLRSRIGAGVQCRAMIRGGAMVNARLRGQYGVFLAAQETWQPV